MDQFHRHSALAHRGGAPLDRATAHIASCEYSTQARLQEERLARKVSPGLFVERGAVQRLPRQDEAALVEFDGSLESAGVGFRADKDKKRPGIEGPLGYASKVLDHEPIEVEVAISREWQK